MLDNLQPGFFQSERQSKGELIEHKREKEKEGKMCRREESKVSAAEKDFYAEFRVAFEVFTPLDYSSHSCK